MPDESGEHLSSCGSDWRGIEAPDDLMVSGSSGSAIEIFLLACPTRTGQRIYHTAALGSMGFGLPCRLRSAIGGRTRTDDSASMATEGSSSTFRSLKRRAAKLPVKFFVLNNDGYASIRASQTGYFGDASIGCDRARAYGSGY